MRRVSFRVLEGRDGRPTRWLVFGALLAAGAVALGSAVAAPPAAGAVLVVKQLGLPWGVKGRITVRGPDGYVRRLRSSAILRNLKRGRYRITARGVSAAYRSYSPTVDRPSVRLRRTSRATVRVRYVRLPLRPDQIAIQIATGEEHACVLTAAGGVKCWGWNAYGQVGDGTTTLRRTPVTVRGLSSGVSAISAGDWHTCALTTAGGALCWGYNQFGQLGDGTGTHRLTPVPVSGLSSGVTAIAASGGLDERAPGEDDLGGEHTCALTTAGSVLCWGDGWFGQLGAGALFDLRLTPVVVNGFSSGATAIAVGGTHSCAITVSGGAKCWGQTGTGRWVTEL
jgi:hypothetical protein